MCSSVSFNSSRFSHFGSDPSEALQWPLDSLGVELLWDRCLRKKVLLALKQAGCFKLKESLSIWLLPTCSAQTAECHSHRSVTELRGNLYKYCSDFFPLWHYCVTILSSSMPLFYWQTVLYPSKWWKQKPLNCTINTWQFLSFLMKYMTANGPIRYLNNPHS